MKVKCSFPQGGLYTYEGPDDAKVGDQLAPEGALSGDLVTVREIGSDYAGPLKRAHRRYPDLKGRPLCPTCGQVVR